MVRGDGGEMTIGYDVLELVEPERIVLRSDPMPAMGCPSRRSCGWSCTPTGTGRG